MSLNVVSSFKSFVSDIKKRKEESDVAKGKSGVKKHISIFTFLKAIFLRFFYTACFLMFLYLIITGCTVFIPFVVGYIIGSLGYGLNNNAEILLSSMSSLFFTAWIFVISFVVVKRGWCKYVSSMRATSFKDM